MIQRFLHRGAPLAAMLLAASAAISQPTGNSHAIVGVTVLPMDSERVLPNQTVLVADGRITRIGPADEVVVPQGANRIDGSNRYLIPALAEMHAHIPPNDAATDAQIERVLFMYAANGIGTIRGMLGHPRHLGFRDRVERGELFSPHIYTSGPSFNGDSAASSAVAVQMVRQQQAAGYDLLKIHPGIRRDVFDDLAAAADEVGIRFSGHVPADVGLHRALELRFDTIDHLDGYIEALVPESAPVNRGAGGLFGVDLADHADPARIPALVEATRAAGTWMVPTQILLENWLDDIPPAVMREWPEMRYTTAAEREQWSNTKQNFLDNVPAARRARLLELRRELIRELHAGGVGFLLGSDAPQVWNVPGFAAHRELAVLVDAGLTPYEALVSGTVNVARYYGTDDRRGRVAEGYDADLVLLDGNPLEDITRTRSIAGVMLQGRWLGRDELQARLDAGR